MIAGQYSEEPELERLMEVRTLIENLNIRTTILSSHVSNTIPLTGILPNDKAMLLRELDKAIRNYPEIELKHYRNQVRHL